MKRNYVGRTNLHDFLSRPCRIREKSRWPSWMKVNPLSTWVGKKLTWQRLQHSWREN